MKSGGYDLMSGRDGRPNWLKYAIAGVVGLCLIAAVIGVAVYSASSHKSSQSNASSNNGISASQKAIEAICQPTDYKQACSSSLSSAAGNTTDPRELIKTGFKVAVNQVEQAIANSSVVKELSKDPMAKKALESCKDLLNYSIDDLQDSFNKLGAFDVSKVDEYLADLNVWLSGAVTFQETCLDGFDNTTGDAKEKMQQILQNSRELTSNALAMVTEISTILGQFEVPGMSRRLLSEEGTGELPSRIDTDGRRRLLQASPTNVKADVIVAQDGSGKYKTIAESLKDIPKANKKTFVIYIKEGVYKEKIIIDKGMTNVMMIGDGPDKSVITGSLNYIDGTQTCNTATFTAIGAGFIAKGIKFENTAGAIKHQAVALRVQSDMSIFYNCEMDAFQDTLYTHAHRQFYQSCTISGTIDFIFGDAPAVFQNCRMIVKKPLDNQQCIVTASGRSERRSASAIILQNCTISADLGYYPVRMVNKAYLGRPWRNYSRAIIMQSQIDDLIAPEGWLPWAGNMSLNTCFYAEYENRGPGASTAKRVTWKGVKKLSGEHISDFTPRTFFKGDQWIVASGVPYNPGMMST